MHIADSIPSTRDIVSALSVLLAIRFSCFYCQLKRLKVLSSPTMNIKYLAWLPQFCKFPYDASV